MNIQKIMDYRFLDIDNDFSNFLEQNDISVFFDDETGVYDFYDIDGYNIVQCRYHELDYVFDYLKSEF